MRRIIIIILLGLMIAGCATQTRNSNIPHELYTQLAPTVAMQLTQQYLLTPSATATMTPEPTPTQTLTPEPSPTSPSPTATWSYHNRGSIDAPILAYYHIADDATDYSNYSADATDQISSAVFQQQMTTLREKGYETINTDVFLNTLLYGAEMPSKPIMITFDSTAAGIYNKAFPIMKAQGYVGVVFVTVSEIGTQGRLTAEQLKELIQAGWTVGSHGMYGRDLTSDSSIISEEISTSRTKLEELIGTPVTVFSYPYGRTNDIILPRVSTWGYSAAFGLHWYDSTTHTTDYMYYFARIEIKNDEASNTTINNLP